MSKLYQNECEIKIRIENQQSINKYKEKLLKLGFCLFENHIETDFIPDTEEFLCKKKNIVLRYRVKESNTKSFLLTLKVKRNNERFQDNLEIEYSSDEYDSVKHDEINKILKENIDIQIPKLIFIKKI